MPLFTKIFTPEELAGAAAPVSPAPEPEPTPEAVAVASVPGMKASLADDFVARYQLTDPDEIRYARAAIRYGRRCGLASRNDQQMPAPPPRPETLTAPHITALFVEATAAGFNDAYPPFDRRLDIFKSHLAAGTDPVEACAIALAS